MTTDALPPLHHLLPHRGPMCLLDRVIRVADETAVCEVDIRPGVSFHLNDAGVPAWVGLEYLAQCAAVLGGVLAWRAGTTPPAGMLLGTRSLKSTVAVFADHTTLRVHCRQQFADAGGMTAYSGHIDQDGQRLLEASFNIFLQTADGSAES